MSNETDETFKSTYESVLREIQGGQKTTTILSSSSDETDSDADVQSTDKTAVPERSLDANIPEAKSSSTIKVVKETDKIEFLIPTVDNIQTMLNPVIDNYAEDLEHFETILGFINFIETLNPTSPISKQLVGYVFMHLVHSNKFLHLDLKYAMLVKALFHKYIIDHKFTHLICLYDKLFNDKLYANIQDETIFYPTLPQEWIIQQVKDYQAKMKEVQIRKAAKRPAPRYSRGEIVGAKDKENKWWLAEVLDVLQFDGRNAYYVEFKGWGEKFNEVIIDGFRIEKYNRKKHMYFRPAYNRSDEPAISDRPQSAK